MPARRIDHKNARRIDLGPGSASDRPRIDPCWTFNRPLDRPNSSPTRPRHDPKSTRFRPRIGPGLAPTPRTHGWVMLHATPTLRRPPRWRGGMSNGGPPGNASRSSPDASRKAGGILGRIGNGMPRPRSPAMPGLHGSRRQPTERAGAPAGRILWAGARPISAAPTRRQRQKLGPHAAA